MRIIALIGAILIALNSPLHATDIEKIESAVKLFQKLANLPPDQKDRCGEILRSRLSASMKTTGSIDNDSIVAVGKKMYDDDKCLDKYSSLGREEKWWVQISGSYLFLNIKYFDRAFTELSDGFRMLPDDWRSSVNTVVIDLRGNRGGDINDLRDILDYYFAPRKGVIYMEVEATDYPPYQVTTRKGILAGIPIIILTDPDTASAAEWMIAVLRFYWFPDTTLIVGPKGTFGKAIIQCGRAAGHFFMQLTCGEWMIADQKVNGVGIEPDRTKDLKECGNNGRNEACVAEALSKMILWQKSSAQ
jgi:hypothetical protein